MSDNTFKFQQQSKKSSSYHSFTSPVALKTNAPPPCLGIVFIIEASVSIFCLSHEKSHCITWQTEPLQSEKHVRIFIVELLFLSVQWSLTFSWYTVSSPGSPSSFNIPKPVLEQSHDPDQDPDQSAY